MRRSLAGLVVLLVAGALRFHALDRQSLWQGEVATLQTLSAPPGAWLKPFSSIQTQPPLYFAQLRLWRLLGARSLVGLRANSAVWGVLGVLFLGLWLRRRLSEQVAWSAAGLLALSPFHLAYSQELQPMAMAVALTTALWWQIERSSSRETRAVWAGLAVTVAALLLTHHAGWVMAIAAYLVALATREPAARRPVHLAFGTAAAVWLCWAPMALDQLRQAETTAFWASSFSATTLVRALGAFWGLFFDFGASTFYLPTRLGVLLLMGIAITAAAAYGWRRAPLSLRTAAMALVALWLTSAWKPGFFSAAGTTALMAPAFLALVAAGALAIGRPALRRVALAACLAVQAWGLVFYFGRSEKGNAKAVVRYVHQLKADNLVVVRSRDFSLLFQFYDQGHTPVVEEESLADPEARAALRGRPVVFVALERIDAVGESLLAERPPVDARYFPGNAHLGVTVYRLGG